LIGLGVTLLIIGIPIYIYTLNTSASTVNADPWANVPDRSVPPVSHIDLMSGTFETGSEITCACLQYHEDASQQMLRSSHFTWLGEPEPMAGTHTTGADGYWTTFDAS
jgi:hypothetical protein